MNWPVYENHLTHENRGRFELSSATGVSTSKVSISALIKEENAFPQSKMLRRIKSRGDST